MKLSTWSCFIASFLAAQAAAIAIPETKQLSVRSYSMTKRVPVDGQKVKTTSPATPVGGGASASAARKTTPTLLEKTVKWQCQVRPATPQLRPATPQLRARSPLGENEKGKGKRGGKGADPTPDPTPKSKKDKKKAELEQPDDYTFTGAEINRVLRVAKAQKADAKYPEKFRNDGNILKKPEGVTQLWEYPIMTGSTDWKKGRDPGRFRMVYTQVRDNIVFVGLIQHPSKDGTEAQTKILYACVPVA